MSDLVTPNDLKRIADEIEARKARETIEKLRKLEADQDELHRAFLERDIRADVKERVSSAVRRAAENGQHEIQALKFPAAWTSDRGRRINNGEQDWPASLEGFAKRSYDFYLKELQPVGYKVRAEVLSYNEGVPGEIAIYLGW
ncbi:MAG TPA: hypothetical protein PKA13_23475 [Geminicoccaceae bacterium]|nr:hypothetical protein [Geminicoccus sp.]HMU52758.1 hypothetical protein [Geminicoccaceae bacterium]